MPCRMRNARVSVERTGCQGHIMSMLARQRWRCAVRSHDKKKRRRRTRANVSLACAVVSSKDAMASVDRVGWWGVSPRAVFCAVCVRLLSVRSLLRAREFCDVRRAGLCRCASTSVLSISALRLASRALVRSRVRALSSACGKAERRFRRGDDAWAKRTNPLPSPPPPAPPSRNLRTPVPLQHCLLAQQSYCAVHNIHWTRTATGRHRPPHDGTTLRVTSAQQRTGVQGHHRPPSHTRRCERYRRTRVAAA